LRQKIRRDLRPLIISGEMKREKRKEKRERIIILKSDIVEQLLSIIIRSKASDANESNNYVMKAHILGSRSY